MATSADRKVCNSCGLELPAGHAGPCPKCDGTIIGIHKGAVDAIPMRDSQAIEFASIAKSRKIRWGLLLSSLILTLIPTLLQWTLGFPWGIIVGLVLSIVAWVLGLWAVSRIEKSTRDHFGFY
jgi:hypothetical protein